MRKSGEKIFEIREKDVLVSTLCLVYRQPVKLVRSSRKEDNHKTPFVRGERKNDVAPI